MSTTKTPIETTEKPTLDSPRRGRGRPKKTELLSNTKGKAKNPVGRPKGDAAIINDYKARMLASPKSRRVMEAIFDAALDDDHKNQAAAWKLIMDRILPVGVFEKDVLKDSSRGAIQININGIGTNGVSIDNQGTTLEGDFSDDN